MSEYDLKFLESIENVKAAVSQTSGREPSSAVAREIAMCLRQGRLYFESAAHAPLEIRPLLLFYGIVAQAKAAIIARSVRPLATLNQAHGLSDITDSGATIINLKAHIGAKGTFQEFNDSITSLSVIHYFGGSSSTPLTHGIPSAPSNSLNGLRITLKDILARIPWLSEHYERTFKERSKCLQLSTYSHGQEDDCVDLRVDVPVNLSDRAALTEVVTGLRQTFPCLRKWTLATAEQAWGNAVLMFENVERDESVNDLTDDSLRSTGERLQTTLQRKYTDFRALLDPVSPSARRAEFTYLVAPLNDEFISEVSLEYIGMFLLSSLVRYRPELWVHSVSRFSYPDKPADDRALTLIEHFLDLVHGRFPEIVHSAIAGV